MVHVIFDPSSNLLNSGGQTGGAYFHGITPYQRGYGPHFVGGRHQRGAGLGDIFRRFWRVLKPMLSNAGKAVGEEGLAATARVLTDVVQGAPLKEAVTSQGQEGVRKLLGRAERGLAQQSGAGRKRKRYYKKKSVSPTKVILKPTDDFVGRLVPAKKLNKKRQKIDNLGSF
jgi:hypothetical protein